MKDYAKEAAKLALQAIAEKSREASTRELAQVTLDRMDDFEKIRDRVRQQAIKRARGLRLVR